MKKRYVFGSMAAACLLLAGVVPAASASNSGASDAPASSSANTGALTANPCAGRPGTAIENVAVRRQPNSGSEQIGTIPGGARVPKTSQYNVEGGKYIGWNGRQNHWWVPVNWNGANGFVAAGWTCAG